MEPDLQIMEMEYQRRKRARIPIKTMRVGGAYPNEVQPEEMMVKRLKNTKQ